VEVIAAMELSFLKPLYQSSGPFASVYLDVGRDHQNARREIALRWRAAREALTRQGADEPTLDALGAVLLRGRDVSGPAGRVAIAAQGRVVFDDLSADPPSQQIARWARLPHILPYLAQRRLPIPYIHVRVGRVSADFDGVDADGAAIEHRVEFDEHLAHKTGGGGWAQRRYDATVEETWRRNAAEVAGELDTIAARAGAELIIIDGDPKERASLLESLATATRSLVADGPTPSTPQDRHTVGSREAESPTAILAAARERHRDQDVEEFHRRRGQEAPLAAEGLEQVLRAFREARVEHLLVVDHPETSQELWIGPDPLDIASSPEELARKPEWLERDRVDAALVRALVATDAKLTVLSQEGATKAAFEPADGLGALLRFTV